MTGLIIVALIIYIAYQILKCHRSPKLSSKSERILLRADTLICQA